MMGNKVLVGRLYGPREILQLDVDSGAISSCAEFVETKVTGNIYILDGHTFALYVEGSTLYFQWDDQRWDFSGLSLKVAYHHDFSRKITVFSVDNKLIEYPAWWNGDPLFDPNIPEYDEEEDYFGYIFSLKNNPSLQISLQKTWSVRSGVRI
ncbi:hypothetical protein A9Q89_01075 [Gammaproteobacteria bacterium 53_120_T64]|nr:hypothetical protein A9Q89_01075 [Gammaproteobacteria bacterium 53_120_T64]